MQDAHRVFIVREKHRLCDLKLESFRRQRRGGERRSYLPDEISAFLEMGRREIDGKTYRRRPIGRSSTGLAQNPLANRHDEAAFLRGGDESGRSQQSALWMAPSQKGLERAN